MFLGSFKTYFTGKNRLVLPKKFRRELGAEDKFYLVKGLDGELWGFNNSEWQKEAEKRLSIPLDLKQGRKIRRSFFAQAEECFLDMQGRFVLPQDFVDFAQIKSEVYMIGAGDHFEIWDAKVWRKEI